MHHVTKIQQHDWTEMYSAAGHGLYTEFIRSFPFLFAEVGLACETSPNQGRKLIIGGNSLLHLPPSLPDPSEFPAEGKLLPLVYCRDN